MASFFSRTIFGKPVEGVTFEDILSFCELKIPEGINLDYKQDLSLPTKLAKSIATFANTRGGLILVGVVDDSDDKPVVPATGMDYDEKMPLTVTNIILSHIYPPVAPQVHVCPKGKGDKTFLLIDIPESTDAPHWVFNKKELYIRVAQRSASGSWEDFATSEQYEWLRNKREKSLDLRWRIIQNLDYHFKECIKKRDVGNTTIYRGDQVTGILTRLLRVSVSPAFPQEALFAVPQSYELVKKIAVQDYYGTDYWFPTFLETRHVFQNGTITHGSFAEPEEYLFSALDTSGTFVYNETVIKEQVGEKNELSYSLDFLYIVARLDQFFTSAANLYKEIGYSGLLRIDVVLNGKSFMRLVLPSSGFPSSKHVSQGANFMWNSEVYTSEISEEKDRYGTIKSIIRELMYMFGIEYFKWEILENYYKSVNRYVFDE